MGKSTNLISDHQARKQARQSMPNRILQLEHVIELRPLLVPHRAHCVHL